MPDHRVVEEWMGRQVTTLADLLGPGLRAVAVGINPSPVSVAAGHYYQGRLGQLFFERLRRVGLLPTRYDAAHRYGLGFTDIVTRPTASAKELRSAEYAHGRQALMARLEEANPRLLIFTFMKAATVVFGPFAGNGFVPSLSLGRSEVFVMPGPYEKTATADPTLDLLAERIARIRAERFSVSAHDLIITLPENRPK